MNIAKVHSIIEQYRTLTGLSSLPFIVDTDKALKTVWFNYYLEQTETQLDITVTSIFFVDDDMNVSETKVDLRITTNASTYDDPQLNERAYIADLQRLLENYSLEGMKLLLSKAEMNPLLVSYDMVSKHIKDN